jgi:hypothetical protein
VFWPLRKVKQDFKGHRLINRAEGENVQRYAEGKD